MSNSHPRVRRNLLAIAGLLLSLRGMDAQNVSPNPLNELQNKNLHAVEFEVGLLAEQMGSISDSRILARIAELMLERKSPESLREKAAFALGQGHFAVMPFVPSLKKALQDPSVKVQRAAAEALGLVGSNTPDVIESLNRRQASANSAVNAACIRSIAQLQSHESASLYLASILDSQNDIEVRRTAAYTLAQIGPEAVSAVPSLMRALDKGDKSLRQVAAWALGLIGPMAEPSIRFLTGALKDREPEVRRESAAALGHIGPVPNIEEQTVVLRSLEDAFRVEKDRDAKTEMADVLAQLGFGRDVGAVFFDVLHSSQDRTLQQAAAAGLARVVPPTNADISLLIQISREEYPDVRSSAIKAIGHIHQKPDISIKRLVEALADPIPSVDFAAAEALAEFQSFEGNGDLAVRGLTQACRRPGTRYIAAKSLGAIGEALRNEFEEARELRRRDYDLAQSLQDAQSTLKDLSESEPDNYFFHSSIVSISAALTVLQQKKLVQDAKDLFITHRYLSVLALLIVAYTVWLCLLFFLILRRFPQSLVRWNDILERLGTISVPVVGSVVLKIRDIVLLHAATHPEVLQAWVEAHADPVAQNFIQQCIRGSRDVFYSLPVECAGEFLAELTPCVLRENCRSRRWMLRITGEGGAGKTTLAFQIALWALHKDVDKRLFPEKRMIPVVLERTTGDNPFQNFARFKNAIKGKLQSVIGDPRPVPDWLCDALLTEGRVLVIVDGISEILSDTDPVLPLDPEYSIAALVTTSRSDKLWAEVTHTDIRPARIDSEHLSPFLNAYLGKRRRLSDIELFDACRRLASLVGKRSITPLLARMYAEQLGYGQIGGKQLPEHIPDLVLGYVSTLNRNRKPTEPDNLTIQRAAQLTAWECCKASFSSGYARREDVAKALRRDTELKAELLEYMERRLLLVRPVPPSEVYVEFLLDPIAEYLAALWLVKSFTTADDWRTILEGFDQSDKKESSLGFMAAVYDCCVSLKMHFNGAQSIREQLAIRVGGRSPVPQDLDTPRVTSSEMAFD